MYKLPDINILSTPETQMGIEPAVLEHTALLLEQVLKSFGIEAIVANTNPGPVVTQYQLIIPPGVKSKRINELSTDLSIALKSKDIRIVTPIPGTDKIGIEVPNPTPQIVHFRDIPIETNDNEITIVLGKDINGNPVTFDLTKAPHLLVAGQTGAGKSVGLNVFLSSILMSKTPDEVKFLLVDPKVVELSVYNDIPHLVAPVVTDPNDATKALKWVVNEMENRYKLLAEYCVRNIAGFNEIKKMPYLVVVIDEMADLMMTAGKEIENYIVRIAQKARAVGIHLILTTQRPTINVITGTIKANLPSRVGFKVASQIDARTIMDNIGCEKLIGNGDMLFQASGSPDTERIHGAFIDTNDVKSIIEHCKQHEYSSLVDFINQNRVEEKTVEAIRDDPKLEEAKALCEEYDNYTVTFLQRKLGLNYSRAKNLLKEVCP